MSKLTRPYFLLFCVGAATTILTFPLAQKRADITHVRRKQEETLSELIAAGKETTYYRRKRHELLSNPATIAEVAKEQYGYIWEEENIGEFTTQTEPEEKKPDQINIVETGRGQLLGDGQYIWKLPVAVLGLCAAVFGVLGLFEKKAPED